MNIVKKALNEAGIRIPIKRRIFNWVQDHPNKTTREIATALNEDYKHVGVELREMVSRGMMKAKPALHRPYSGIGRKSLLEYSVTINNYELLPKAKSSVSTYSPVTVVKYERPEPEPLKHTTIDVDSLSIAEARRIYDRLKEIFG